MDLRSKVTGFFSLFLDLLISVICFFVIVSWYFGGDEIAALGALCFYLVGSLNGLLAVWILLAYFDRLVQRKHESES